MAPPLRWTILEKEVLRREAMYKGALFLLALLSSLLATHALHAIPRQKSFLFPSAPTSVEIKRGAVQGRCAFADIEHFMVPTKVGEEWQYLFEWRNTLRDEETSSRRLHVEFLFPNRPSFVEALTDKVQTKIVFYSPRAATETWIVVIVYGESPFDGPLCRMYIKTLAPKPQ